MERSRSLHNFNLPQELTWGRQKLLTCKNVNPDQAMPGATDGESSYAGEYNKNRSIGNNFVEGGVFNWLQKDRSGDEICDGGDKLMIEEKNRRLILKKGALNDQTAPIYGSTYPNNGEDQNPILDSKSPQKSPAKVSPPPLPPCIISSEGGGDGGINASVEDLRFENRPTRPRRNLNKNEGWPKFSISLSREEIEEDFIAMTGKPPPRKPKKLSRSIQTKLNGVFPGARLSEVNPDRYKVNGKGKI